MAASLWLTLLVACIVISFTPGAGAINTMGNALNHGFRRAIWGILGQQAALVVHIAIVALGVGVLVASSPVLFNVIRYAGAAYLAYLGLRLLVQRPSPQAEGAEAWSAGDEVTRRRACAGSRAPRAGSASSTGCSARSSSPSRCCSHSSTDPRRPEPRARAATRRPPHPAPGHQPARGHRSRNAQSGRCPARTNERTMSASPCRRSIASAIAA